MKTIYTVMLAVLMALIPSCGNWEPSENARTIETQEVNMPGSPVTAADYVGSLPLASINCPDAGNEIKAEDLRQPVAALLAEADDIRNNATTGLAAKVDRVGDTMTGKLTITTSVATSEAIRATGGSIGPGGRFFGGSTEGSGVISTGTGNAYGLQATGGSSNGGALLATPGVSQTATSPELGISVGGYVRFTGADPNPTVNPGANNALHGANIIKSWVTIDDTYAILDGYNIASVTNVLGDIWEVTFVRPMANAFYGVKIHVHGALGYSGAHNGTKSTTGFRFVLFKTTDLSTGFGTASEAYIEVTGRQ